MCVCVCVCVDMIYSSEFDFELLSYILSGFISLKYFTERQF